MRFLCVLMSVSGILLAAPCCLAQPGGGGGPGGGTSVTLMCSSEHIGKLTDDLHLYETSICPTTGQSFSMAGPDGLDTAGCTLGQCAGSIQSSGPRTISPPGTTLYASHTYDCSATAPMTESQSTDTASMQVGGSSVTLQGYTELQVTNQAGWYALYKITASGNNFHVGMRVDFTPSTNVLQLSTAMPLVSEDSGPEDDELAIQVSGINAVFHCFNATGN